MKCCFGERKKSKDQGRTHQSNLEMEIGKDKESNQTLSALKFASGKEPSGKEGEESEEMRKSRLLGSTDVMDFKMDDPEGISHTPYISTFRYESILSHSLLSPGRQ